MYGKSLKNMSDEEIRQYMIAKDRRIKKIVFMVILAVITIAPAVARYKEILALLMGR